MAYDLNFYTRDVVFELMFGTSLSAPLVTSAVALAKKANPNLTPTQVKKLLMLSSDNYRHVTGAWRVIDVEKTYKCEQLNCGAGILNAKRLVEMALLYKQGKVDKITHAVTDNMGCKDKWLFDNVGDKLKLCQLYKITFVVDTLSTKYSLHRSPIGVAFDDTSEKVLITQEGEVYSADIDADTFN